jgi:hypothetical protein
MHTAWWICWPSSPPVLPPVECYFRQTNDAGIVDFDAKAANRSDGYGQGQTLQ